MKSVSRDDHTIRDFGDQWSHFGDNDGYYGSVELLADILGPLVSFDQLRGARVADVGSGTGRIVRMLLDVGVESVVAVEPSVGVDILRENLREFGERVEVIHGRGDELPAGRELDFAISIGVIQFIRDPQPTLRAAREALRPGGKVVIWVYGHEGNAAYVLALTALRSITTRLPHWALAGFCQLMTGVVGCYIALCKLTELPLPLRDYLVNTLARLTRRERVLTIYDQLNPSYVKYYRRSEVADMLERAGFADVELYHRRAYSWTATGTRPAAQGENLRNPSASSSR
ncbi:MAG: class I SAM-dependent methyltransferase [Myxococcota bacterium]